MQYLKCNAKSIIGANVLLIKRDNARKDITPMKIMQLSIN